jgi:hypothetical protein
MICEIINPSDSYTLETEDFTAAAVGIYMVGRGQLGLRSIDDKESSPILFGWDEWLTDRGVKEGYVTDHLDAIATALESVMIGGVNDRIDVKEATENMSNDQKKAFLKRRQDRRRSSMSDIGGACHRYAMAIRKKQHELAKKEGAA